MISRCYEGLLLIINNVGKVATELPKPKPKLDRTKTQTMNTDPGSSPTLKQQILDTWFKDTTSNRLDLPQTKRWFNGGKSFDKQLTRDFSDAVNKAGNGAFDDWMEDAVGSLALLVLLDQFARNIFRGSAKAFAFDPKAQSVCLDGLAKGFDKNLPITQRIFYYLPLEHAESHELQAESLKRFTALHAQSSQDLKEFTRRTLDSAIEHKAIIDAFGRYPYRNAVLSRENTLEEERWLADSNKRFGQ